jgi:hypothetical protein
MDSSIAPLTLKGEIECLIPYPRLRQVYSHTLHRFMNFIFTASYFI